MSQKQEGIKPSRKYANGTVHENASGRFMILDRFLGKDGIIYMKIQWLTTGEVETNKEVNISASIWKFEKARGKVKPPEEKEPIPAITPADTLEKLEELEHYLVEQHESRKNWQEHMDKIHENMINMAKEIHDVYKVKADTLNVIKKLTEQVSVLQKEVKDKNDTIHQIIEKQKTQSDQVDMLIKNYDIASKLIEKM